MARPLGTMVCVCTILVLSETNVGKSRRLVADAFVSRPELRHDVNSYLGDRSVSSHCYRRQQCSSSTFRIALAAKKTESTSNEVEDDTTFFYNDDAFGLIFLTASLALRDLCFAAAFLFLSAIAATAVSANVFKFQPVLPGVVAYVALALSKLEPLSSAAQAFGVDIAMPLDDNGRNIELAICAISLIWGIIQQRRPSSDKS